MTVVKKTAKNFSYLVLARTAFRILTAAVLIYAARYLGVERFGMFETALAWSNAFLAINDLGMSTLIVREAARDESKMSVYFGNTLLVEVILSAVLYGVILAVGVGIGYNSTTILLMAILGGAGLIYEFRKVMRGIFRVLLKLKAVAVLEVLNGALYLLLALWIFSSVQDIDLGLLGLAHSRLWVNVLVVVALFVYTLRFVKPRFDHKQIVPMIKQSYVFTLYNMFFMLYFQIDQIMLSILKTQVDVGIYSASAKIVAMLLFVPIMVFQVIMPTMYKLSTTNIEKYKRVNQTIWRYLAAFGIPAGVGIVVLSPQIVDLVYGAEYLATVPVLAVMGWFLAVRFTGLSQGNSMTTTDRQGLRAAIQIVSVGVNIALDLVLIRIYGAIGAAYATLITETIIASSYLIFSARYLKESLPRNLLLLLPIVLATAGMAGAITLIQSRLHVILVVICGALVYLVLLWAFRFFQPYDKKIFSQLTSKS